MVGLLNYLLGLNSLKPLSTLKKSFVILRLWDTAYILHTHVVLIIKLWSSDKIFFYKWFKKLSKGYLLIVVFPIHNSIHEPLSKWQWEKQNICKKGGLKFEFSNNFIFRKMGENWRMSNDTFQDFCQVSPLPLLRRVRDKLGKLCLNF